MYRVFATEWSKPQNANTMMGNITPTVVDKPLRGAYFTAPMERVIKNPQRIAEQHALIAQRSAKIFAEIIVCAVGMTRSAKGENLIIIAVTSTPSIFPIKQTGSFQKFLAPISGMSEIKPVNSFISNITMERMPKENSVAPISLPQLPNKWLASKNAEPPMPIMIPEQKDIKQKDTICAFVNFSTGFIKIPPCTDCATFVAIYNIIMQRRKKSKSKWERIYIFFRKILRFIQCSKFLLKTA